MLKTKLINLLGQKYGYTRLLEISAEGTGNYHSEFDRQQFSNCDLIKYRCSPLYSRLGSGQMVTSASTSSELVSAALEMLGPETYDVVFVDPFHTYRDSLTDIIGGLLLLNKEGILVVHDCNPPTRAVMGREKIPGDWCGQTYAAFLDVVINRRDLNYFTVDTDWGCGVIRKRPRDWEIDPRLELAWATTAMSPEDRADIFEGSRAELLRLQSVADFCRYEGFDIPLDVLEEEREVDRYVQAFNETAYLAANPDIAEAVRAGLIASGYDHYRSSGAKEGRSLRPAVPSE